MRVAVAASDERVISEHFSRTSRFLIYDIQDGQVRNKESHDVVLTDAQWAACELERAGNSDSVQPDYQPLLDVLDGCQVVLCRGMGWRAAQELVRHGVNPIVILDQLTPDQAVEKYIWGGLTPGKGFCRPGGRLKAED